MTPLHTPTCARLPHVITPCPLPTFPSFQMSLEPLPLPQGVGRQGGNKGALAPFLPCSGQGLHFFQVPLGPFLSFCALPGFHHQRPAPKDRSVLCEVCTGILLWHLPTPVFDAPFVWRFLLVFCILRLCTSSSFIQDVLRFVLSLFWSDFQEKKEAVPAFLSHFKTRNFLQLLKILI